MVGIVSEVVVKSGVEVTVREQQGRVKREKGDGEMGGGREGEGGREGGEEGRSGGTTHVQTPFLQTLEPCVCVTRMKMCECDCVRAVCRKHVSACTNGRMVTTHKGTGQEEDSETSSHPVSVVLLSLLLGLLLLPLHPFWVVSLSLLALTLRLNRWVVILLPVTYSLCLWVTNVQFRGIPRG